MPTTKTETAATLLRSWRGERTLREAASELGISHSSIVRYERGDQIPPVDLALHISDVTGIPVHAWGGPRREGTA